jgi:hypothetical protein
MLEIFIFNFMFPNDSFISPFLQLINALEVARNGRPKIKQEMNYMFQQVVHLKQ